jgi:4-oxalocrotonate tautomerase
VPHVNIKHWPRTFTDAEKANLVASLTETITRAFGCEPGSVSIAVEPVEPSRWMDRVHTPELEERSHLLWKQPNYSKPIPTEGTR